ncbi:zinc finger protein 479-like isoform X2 [Periplaneta americana]
MESVDPGYELVSTVGFGKTPVSITFPVVKSEPEEELHDIGVIEDEMNLDVTTENDEFLAERTIQTHHDSIGESDNSEVWRNEISQCYTLTEEEWASIDESAENCIPVDNTVREEAFCCEICHKVFTTSDSSVKHLSTHKQENPDIWKFLGECLGTSNSSKQQISTHALEKSFTCDFCGEDFPTSVARDNHTRTHSGEDILKLLLNGEQLQSKKSSKKLRRDLTFCPGVCDTEKESCGRESAPEEQNLEVAAKKKEVLTERTWNCKTTQPRHLSIGGILNGEVPNTEISQHCDLQLQEPTAMQCCPPNSVHREEIELSCPFQRNIFNMGFTKDASREHSGIYTDERLFKCKICGADKMTSYLLRIHMRLHKGEKLKCNTCAKFLQRLN